jgi:hypothetical protein
MIRFCGGRTSEQPLKMESSSIERQKEKRKATGQ